MRYVVIALVCLCVCPSLVCAQFKDTAPRCDSPRLWQASATLADSRVMIQIARPSEQATPDGGRRPDGVVIQPSGMVMNWVNDPRKLTLGKNVVAYRADGKVMEADALLKALAKPKGVAVFVRADVSKSKPEAFYLGLLREDTLVLVAEHKDIYPTEP
ncbi:MAG TPA: hypothetical protein VKS79_09645 [Gemmataceae bacterium]|nr:hypothetical protein [Gemmataceae bacterium]